MIDPIYDLEQGSSVRSKLNATITQVNELGDPTGQITQPTLVAEVVTLEAAVASQSTDIVGLDIRLTTAETDITAIEVEQGNQSTDIASMDARIDVVQTSIVTLNGEQAIQDGRLDALEAAGSAAADHGTLLGLADDDHPQYFDATRGDDRYALIGHGHTGIYEPVQTPASQVEMEAGTETALRSMSPLRVAQAISALGGGGVTDHGALTGLSDDDHSQYHTDARGDLRYSALGHVHPASAITNTPAGSIAATTVQAAINELDSEKAATGHDHAGVYEPVQTAASQIEMEAGTEAAIRSVSPLRVAQAIAALIPYDPVITATSVTAVTRQHVEVTAASQTVTLPASPSLGDEVSVGVGDFTNTIIGRNGELIQSLAENMTVDVGSTVVALRFIGGSIGWRIIV